MFSRKKFPIYSIYKECIFSLSPMLWPTFHHGILCLNDILFIASEQNALSAISFIRRLKDPSTCSEGTSTSWTTLYVSSCPNSTHSSIFHRLNHVCLQSRKFFCILFNSLCLWDALLTTDLSTSFHILSKARSGVLYLWSRSIDYLDPQNPCTFHCLCPCSKCYAMYIHYLAIVSLKIRRCVFVSQYIIILLIKWDKPFQKIRFQNYAGKMLSDFVKSLQFGRACAGDGHWEAW